MTFDEFLKREWKVQPEFGDVYTTTFVERYAELVYKSMGAESPFGGLSYGVTQGGGLYGHTGFVMEEYHDYSAMENQIVGFYLAHPEHEALKQQLTERVQAIWNERMAKAETELTKTEIKSS